MDGGRRSSLTTVEVLAQTPDGYLCGTEDGRVRFDGLRFTPFNRRQDPRLQHPVADHIEEAILAEFSLHRSVLSLEPTLPPIPPQRLQRLLRLLDLARLAGGGDEVFQDREGGFGVAAGQLHGLVVAVDEAVVVEDVADFFQAALEIGFLLGGGGLGSQLFEARRGFFEVALADQVFDVAPLLLDESGAGTEQVVGGAMDGDDVVQDLPGAVPAAGAGADEQEVEGDVGPGGQQRAA